MAQRKDVVQRKSVDIGRGLFLLRYASAEDTAVPPIVRVAADASDSDEVELVLHPDAPAALLSEPGSCLVIRSESAATLTIEVSASKPGGSAAAVVKIEPLSQGEPRPELRGPSAPAAGSFDSSGLQVQGHVAMIGDVSVGPDEWLAGPEAPSRIEGISIDWPNKPADLDVRYAVKLAKPHQASGRMMPLGSFAGTKGRALAVVGLVFEMSGPASANCQFAAEALFLGSPVMSATGKRLVLSGPSGREALVGLKLSFEEIDHKDISSKGSPQKSAGRPSAPPSSSAERPARSTGRVRVFRSRAKEDQASSD
jgi:hypothetical protein